MHYPHKIVEIIKNYLKSDNCILGTGVANNAAGAPPVPKAGEGAAINVRVLHDQGYEQRLQELHRQRDAEMAAIKQYTSDVVEKEDLTEDDLVEITEVLNIIIRAQESQQRELMHGIPDFVRSGARPEDVRERIEESMARYQEEEDEALRRMKAIMERGAPGPVHPLQRVLRPRRRPAAAAAAAEEPNASHPDDEQQQTNQDPFREGLVRHISRIVELNRQLRQESLAQNVALLEKLPKDGRLLGMVVLPHQRTKDAEKDNAGPAATMTLDHPKNDLVQSLREGEAVWIPAEPPEVPVPVPALPRMERRGAIVEEDMRQDVQSLQTNQWNPNDAEPSTSTTEVKIEHQDNDVRVEKGSEEKEEPDQANGETNEANDTPVRVLRRRVLVLNNAGEAARDRHRERRQDNEEDQRVGNENNAEPVQAQEQQEPRGRRRRGRPAAAAGDVDPDQPPVRRARQH